MRGCGAGLWHMARARDMGRAGARHVARDMGRGFSGGVGRADREAEAAVGQVLAPRRADAGDLREALQ